MKELKIVNMFIVIIFNNFQEKVKVSIQTDIYTKTRKLCQSGFHLSTKQTMKRLMWLIS